MRRSPSAEPAPRRKQQWSISDPEAAVGSTKVMYTVRDCIHGTYRKIRLYGLNSCSIITRAGICESPITVSHLQQQLNDAGWRYCAADSADFEEEEEGALTDCLAFIRNSHRRTGSIKMHFSFSP